ncbi:MAG: hypothetical protein IJ333_03780 [Clostridia bacterium]|nr:hypothetical protein [Clostridia bacterium]
MKHNSLLKTIGCISASIALGILIQIFLPDILIIAIVCVLVVVMGIVIAKFN